MMEKKLIFKCAECASPEAELVEELYPVSANRFIDFFDDGVYETEEAELSVLEASMVSVRYHCSECGAEVLAGVGLQAMRRKMLDKLKEKN